MKRWVEQIISIPLSIFIFPFVATVVHHEMTIEAHRVKKLKKASYEEVKEKMLTSKWVFDPKYPNALFSEDYWNGSYFHAGIICFDGVGYLLTFYGLMKAKKLQQEIAKSLPGYCDYRKPYIK